MEDMQSYTEQGELYLYQSIKFVSSLSCSELDPAIYHKSEEH